jgi:predicted GH43/DUF377 family glycosyl hydrolase
MTIHFMSGLFWSEKSDMKWKKLGLVYIPNGKQKLGRSHASLPVPLRIDDFVYRVFFASRDDRNYSHIWSIDVELSREKPKVLSRSMYPLLNPGPIGHFDDCGVYPSSIVQTKDTIFLYYIGWVKGAASPVFYTNTGLAISTDNGKSFKKYSPAPILSRDEIDPWMVTSSFVIKIENSWKMWYVGGSHWDDKVVPWQSYYNIKFAESSDGINWIKKNHVCIPLAKKEYNISRTCVVPKYQGYEAWYGYNTGLGYRIGYAKSDDGLAWNRHDDEAGISLSHSGWDSEAQSYPYVFDNDRGRFMFYNGNGFGLTGLGLAVLE